MNHNNIMYNINAYAQCDALVLTGVDNIFDVGASTNERYKRRTRKDDACGHEGGTCVRSSASSSKNFQSRRNRYKNRYDSNNNT